MLKGIYLERVLLMKAASYTHHLLSAGWWQNIITFKNVKFASLSTSEMTVLFPSRQLT